MFPVLPLIATVAATAAPPAAAQDAACDIHAEPVVQLSYGSRYTDDSKTRSDIDEASNAEVNEALRPIDDFIQDLAREANRAVAAEDEAEAGAHADCVVDALYDWARDLALSELDTINAQMSVGGRLAGFGMALLQVEEMTSRTAELDIIRSWLATLATRQVAFWETDAPPGASQNNLRAWAGLATTTIGLLTDDPELLDWSRTSASIVLCTAAEDGGLEREMMRAQWALHYQLHAIAPLSLIAALLEPEGRAVHEECDGALQRAVHYAVDDLQNEGAATEATTGRVQTYFDGSEDLRSFEVAWAEAYLSLHDDPKVDAFVEPYRPLSNSKLGGSQAPIWGAPDGD